MSAESFSRRPAHASDSPFPWRLVAVVSVLLLELSLIVPWIHLLAVDGGAGIWAFLIWLLVYAWLARSLTRLADRWRLRSGLAMLASTAGLVVGLLVTVNLAFTPARPLALASAAAEVVRAIPMIYPMAPELPLLVLVLLIWRLGVAAASPSILDPGRTSFKFRLGVIIYGLLTLFGGSRVGRPIPSLLPLFFFSSLLAMSLARADRISRLRGAAEPPFSTQWLLSLAALFAAVVVLGVGLGALLDSNWAHGALRGLRALLLIALGLLYRLLLPAFIALEPLLGRLVAWLHGLFTSMNGLSGPLSPNPPPAGQELADLPPPPIFEAINRWLAGLQPYWPILRVGLISLLLALLVFSTIRLIRRARRTGWQAMESEDRGETVAGERILGDWSRRWRQLQDDLWSLGRSLFSGRLRSALVARRIYARLLALAASEGRARHKWETPLEFQGALIRLFPQAAEPIRQITATYIQVRYGETPESELAIRRIRDAWAELTGLVGK